MSDWFLNLSIPWMAFVVFAATHLTGHRGPGSLFMARTNADRDFALASKSEGLRRETYLQTTAAALQAGRSTTESSMHTSLTTQLRRTEILCVPILSIEDNVSPPSNQVCGEFRK